MGQAGDAPGALVGVRAVDLQTPEAIQREAAGASGSLGLSARLLILTAAFVMLAEVLIYIPSVANFRRTWLNDRISGAQMVTLFLDGSRDARLPPAIEEKLLAGVKARAIAVRGEGTRWLMAGNADPAEISRTIDLRAPRWHELIGGAVSTLFRASDKPVRVLGEGMGEIGWVEVILDERPLRDAMLVFSGNILFLSLIISLVTAGLVYLSLQLMIVRPVRRLAGNIAAFAGDPENAAKIIAPSARNDEIGQAEQALARMETALAAELRQKRRLADLGLAVSKINHELRNMLTTAQLLGDRLGELDDPTARRIVPRLTTTVARAIDFCEATLAYGRARERLPQRRRIRLEPVVAELVDADSLAPGPAIAYEARIPADLEVDADPDQLARILANLLRNATQALAAAGTAEAAPQVTIEARRENGAVRITVADNGPGIPPHARDHLFSAFQGSTRSGGTGLGLPVADELVRLHGGTIALEDTPSGARFCVVIPDRAQD